MGNALQTWSGRNVREALHSSASITPSAGITDAAEAGRVAEAEAQSRDPFFSLQDGTSLSKETSKPTIVSVVSRESICDRVLFLFLLPSLPFLLLLFLLWDRALLCSWGSRQTWHHNVSFPQVLGLQMFITMSSPGQYIWSGGYLFMYKDAKENSWKSQRGDSSKEREGLSWQKDSCLLETGITRFLDRSWSNPSHTSDISQELNVIFPCTQKLIFKLLSYETWLAFLC